MRNFSGLLIVVGLSGCAAIGALGGNTSDCASANSQLTTAKAALAVAQIGLSNAQALGADVTLEQTAVSTISEDVASIEALVNSSCSAGVTAETAIRMARAAPPVITLAKARTLAAADKSLAAAVSARRK